MKITKRTETEFFVETDEVLGDGVTTIKGVCMLADKTLVTLYNRGCVVVLPIRVKLGPISLATVSKMGIGETVVLS
jgi:hypothetical protein